MGHDQLFKDVLRAFFYAFLTLFFPGIAKSIDPETIGFLDTQTFTDLPQGSLRIADLVAAVCPLDANPPVVLIHTEVQSQPDATLGFRVAEYNNLLTLRTGHPTISIALRPFDAEFGVAFARHTVTLFGQAYTKQEYWQIDLRGLNAADYLKAAPILGAALAALMRPGPGGKVDLKIAIIKRLRASNLDEARLYLLVNFVETYLKLSDKEQAAFRARQHVQEGEESVEATELTWAEEMMQRGHERGTLQAKRATVARQVRARFGAVPANLEARLADADNQTLDALLDRVVQVASLEEFAAAL